MVSKQERKAPVQARIVMITGITPSHVGHLSAAAIAHYDGGTERRLDTYLHRNLRARTP
jgi:hypothetical protein